MQTLPISKVKDRLNELVDDDIARGRAEYGQGATTGEDETRARFGVPRRA